jgi:hypothetical protein
LRVSNRITILYRRCRSSVNHSKVDFRKVDRIVIYLQQGKVRAIWITHKVPLDSRIS